MKRKAIPVLCNLAGTLILLSVILSCVPFTLPRLMGYGIYGVVSGSMEPEIPVGSVVYVEEARPEEIPEGDIIAFRGGESLIIHRVVQNKVVEGEFVTKGDANAAQDREAVPYARFAGRVACHIPGAGPLMALYAGPVGKSYAILFALCGAMLNMLAGRLRRHWAAE